MKITVNADDYGKDKDTSLAISKCMSDKIVDTTTIMINMPYASQAIANSKNTGFFDKIGLHINLTEGIPLTDRIKELPMFCNKDGSFNALFHHNQFKRLYLNKSITSLVVLEMQAQIEKYLSYGFPLMHIDSHHHVHTDYSITRVLIPLLKKYDFKSIRISRNMVDDISLNKLIYKKIYNNNIKKLELATTDFFGSAKNYKHFREKIPSNASVEIMTHPQMNNNILIMDKDLSLKKFQIIMNE